MADITTDTIANLIIDNINDLVINKHVDTSADLVIQNINDTLIPSVVRPSISTTSLPKKTKKKVNGFPQDKNNNLTMYEESDSHEEDIANILKELEDTIGAVLKYKNKNNTNPDFNNGTNNDFIITTSEETIDHDGTSTTNTPLVQSFNLY
jgi:hypothetical protein